MTSAEESLMSLTIEFSPAEEARLAAIARREGLASADLVRKVVAEHLAPDPHGEGTPEEADEANQLWEEFQANLSESRSALGLKPL
jgi:hypothetical protein